MATPTRRSIHGGTFLNVAARRHLLFAAALVSLFLYYFYQFIPLAPSLLEYRGYTLFLLRDAARRGAVCLDGSPPGFILRKAQEPSSMKWLLFLEGGGWCHHTKQCWRKSKTDRGSSRHWDLEDDVKSAFTGILDSDKLNNPEFHDWNVVLIKYCDGSSFSGNVDGSLSYEGGGKFYSRGSRIFTAVVGSLLTLGLNSATDVLLAGCSAGGLATLLHCNSLKASLPAGSRYKCLADGGLFLDAPDLRGNFTLRSTFQSVLHIHKPVLPEACTSSRSKVDSWQCLFPSYFVGMIKPPVFIVNSFHDTWQNRNSFVPKDMNPQKKWKKCTKFGGHRCSKHQMSLLQRYRSEAISSIAEVQNSSTAGYFLLSCFRHCLTIDQSSWHSKYSVRIQNAVNGEDASNRTISASVGDWFFDRKESKAIDCAAPCNPTC